MGRSASVCDTWATVPWVIGLRSREPAAEAKFYRTGLGGVPVLGRLQNAGKPSHILELESQCVKLVTDPIKKGQPQLSPSQPGSPASLPRL